MNQKYLEGFAKILIWVGILFFVGSIMYFGFITDFADDDTIDGEITGAIGSLVGGVAGVLFSLASVFLFYLALISQKEELSAQRDQLILQREELVLQRIELVETRATFKLQQFESAFFNLLSSQQQIRTLVQAGEDNFSSLEKELGNRLDRFQLQLLETRYLEYGMGVIYQNVKAETFEQFANIAYRININKLKEDPQKHIYEHFLEDYSSILVHYINNLFIVVKYLLDSEKSLNADSDIDYPQYFDYIIAPMSKPELYLIGQHLEAFPNLAHMMNHYRWTERFDNDTGLMI